MSSEGSKCSGVHIEMASVDDLLALQVTEVEQVLGHVRRALSQLSGYEAEVVDALEVLKRRAAPLPPEPPPPPDPPSGGDQTAGIERDSDRSEDEKPSPTPTPKPSRRKQEQIRKRAGRIREFRRVGRALKRGLINIEQFDELTESGLGVLRIDELLDQVIESGSADATRRIVADAKREADRTDPRVRLLRQKNLRRFAHGVDEHGNFWFNLVVDPVVGEAILRLFEKAERAEWQSSDKNKKKDAGRTPANRAADAFAGLILDRSKAKKSKKGDLPEHGAHLVIDIPNLLKLALGDRFATAYTINGSPVPAVEWQKLVDARAEVFAWVLAADGIDMNLARSSRHATEVQKFAMAIRDGGCVSEHCNRSSGACDGHHLVEWQDYGASDIASMALQCPSDHHRTHESGAVLRPGPKLGEWNLVQKNTGRLISSWTNPAPPWRNSDSPPGFAAAG